MEPLPKTEDRKTLSRRQLHHYKTERGGQFPGSPQPTSASPCKPRTTTRSLSLSPALVTREAEGGVQTTVYRKLRHTNQCPAYHPESVPSGTVKCLNDLAERIITNPSGTAQENKHLSCRKQPKPRTQCRGKKPRHSCLPSFFCKGIEAMHNASLNL